MNKLVCILLFCAAAGIGYLVLNQKQDSRENIKKKNGSITEEEAFKMHGGKLLNGQNSSSKQIASLTNLPGYIAPLLQFDDNKPSWETIKLLVPKDKDILLKLYRQEQSLVKKHALIIALGQIGDEEIVRIFIHALSDEYAGRKLKGGGPESNEDVVMMATVSGLGFLAGKSDSAYEFLKKGIDPKFWKETCKFIPANDPGLYGTLAGDAIEAIGRSGRPDASNILEALKPLPLVNYLDNSIMQESFEGAVFDAAFANDMISQKGMDYYRYLYFNPDASLQRMQEWQKSGIGLEWDKWYLKKKME